MNEFRCIDIWQVPISYKKIAFVKMVIGLTTKKLLNYLLHPSVSVQTIIELQFVLSTKRTGCMQRLNPQKLNYEYLYCKSFRVLYSNMAKLLF